MKNNKQSGFAGLAVAIAVLTIGGIGFYQGANVQSKKDVIGANDTQPRDHHIVVGQGK